MSLPLAVERSSAGAPASQPAADEREFVISRVFVAPKRLVFVVSFSDEKAGATRHPFSADWPLEVLNTLTLAEREGRTTLKLRGVPVNATEAEWRTFDAAGLQGDAGPARRLPCEGLSVREIGERVS